MSIGSIEWFNPAKGYGFIRKPDGESVYLPRSALAASGGRGWTVTAGETVEFEEMAGEKGRTARFARPCRIASRKERTQ